MPTFDLWRASRQSEKKMNELVVSPDHLLFVLVADGDLFEDLRNVHQMMQELGFLTQLDLVHWPIVGRLVGVHFFVLFGQF